MDTQQQLTRRSKRQRTDASYVDNDAGSASVTPGRSEESPEKTSSGEEFKGDVDHEDTDRDTDADVDADADEDEEEDLSCKVVSRKYKEATAAIKRVMKDLISKCKPNMKIGELCAIGDSLIKKEAQSVYKRNSEMKKVLAEDNVVKINTAIHIDGFIAAAAHTLLISDKPIPNRTADVIGAAEIAGESMLKRVKAGTKIKEFIKAVRDAVAAFDCQALHIQCHQLKKFQIGEKPMLSDSSADDKDNDNVFELNQVYIFDIITSTREGNVELLDDKHTNVYKLVPPDELQLQGNIPASYLLIKDKFQECLLVQEH